MDNLLLSFNVVAPLIFFLLLGIILKPLLSTEVISSMNRVLSTVFLPILIFCNIYDTGGSLELDSTVFLFIFIGIILELIISVVLCKCVQKDIKRRSVMIQGMLRGNFVIFGIPIAISVFGQHGASSAAIASILVVPMFNVISVSVFALYSGEKLKISSLLLKIAKNPFIIASVIGLVFSFAHIPLPQFIYSPLSDIGDAASSLVFVFLGASFKINSMKEHLPALSLTVLMRLVFFPLIFVSLAIFFGFRGESLIILLTIFASPTAVASYPLAKSMGGDDKLAGNIVVFTSTISILTMFIWIFTLNSLSLL